MSARKVDPTGETAQPGAQRAPDGPGRGGGVWLLAFVATAVGATLVSILVLLALPDQPDGLPKALARTHDAVSPRAVGITGARARRLGHRVVLTQAEVAIPSTARATSVPQSFLGISTEYWALPLYERNISLFERVLSLLQVRGDGPFVLRIGGDSADHTFWDPKMRKVPPWVFKLTPGWLHQTSKVVRRAGVRLILDLNLLTNSPPIAALWARTAETYLPHRSIVGFEVGNEPDIYSRWYWLAITARARPGAGVLPMRVSASSYSRAFRSYARVLTELAPGVPIIGPALANPALNVSWIARLLNDVGGAVGVVSGHRYPYSACVAPRSPAYPTVARLLSENASAGMARAVGPAVSFAHRAGLPFRMTELNSVTCGGRPGVSNTFATALWAPDALFELLRVGVDGINVHVRTNAINAAFAMNQGGLEARPLLYGLILFARTMGPHPERVDLQLHAPRSLQLKAWAVRVRGDVLHVLLIDKSNRPVRVKLQLPASGPATVQRLLAPSAGARSGITLDGQWLGTDGRWQGSPASRKIASQNHGYVVTMPPMSAALVRVRLRPGH